MMPKKQMHAQHCTFVANYYSATKVCQKLNAHNSDPVQELLSMVNKNARQQYYDKI